MALFGQKYTRDELISRAAERFKRKIGQDTTAIIFSEYLTVLEELQEADGSDAVGFILLKNYKTFGALYNEVFEGDYKLIRELVGDDIGALFAFFQEVATAPLSGGGSSPGAGA